jgi:hypothetical protein
MPDHSKTASPSLAAAFTHRLLYILIILIGLVTLYLEGATAYNNTNKAVVEKAKADNAHQRLKAEAELPQQQARIALEAAHNAAVKEKADADRAEAEAAKAEAEAVTARSTADFAKLQAQALAQKIHNLVLLKKQELLTEIANARTAARLYAAETDRLESEYNSTKAAWDYAKRALGIR